MLTILSVEWRIEFCDGFIEPHFS